MITKKSTDRQVLEAIHAELAAVRSELAAVNAPLQVGGMSPRSLKLLAAIATEIDQLTADIKARTKAAGKPQLPAWAQEMQGDNGPSR